MWRTQKGKSFSFEVGEGRSRGTEKSFRDRILEVLAEQLGSSVLNAQPSQTAPDFCFQLPGMDHPAIVELKIGDPELPLPSSTLSQVRLMMESIRQTGVSPTAIVVTNYQVYPSQKEELESNGIKLVTVSPKAGMAKIVEEIKSAAGGVVEIGGGAATTTV
jgi:hypothetical protein